MHFRTIAEHAAALRTGEYSSVELTRALLERIDKLEPRLNAFSALCPERALSEAERADAQRRAGTDLCILHGIPYAAKDLIDVEGMPTAAGASFLADNVRPRDATVIRRLADAGMVLLGKTNVVQLAYGGIGINHDIGTPHNPWHERPHLPGGSSGGSAVSIAGGLVPMALGSDTGGSVRMPSTYCGVTGLKTTVGQISRADVFALAWSFDSIGPLARSAEDAAHVYESLQGASPDDAATAGRPRHDVCSLLNEGVRAMRVAFATGPGFDSSTAEAVNAVQAAGAVLRDLGAEVEDVDLPEIRRAFESEALRRIMGAQSWIANREIYEKHHDEMDPIVADRLAMGRDITSEQYLLLQREMVRLRNEIEPAMSGIDALLMPTTVGAAAPVEEVDATLDSYFEFNLAAVRNCHVGNLLNLCAVSVPCGFGGNGLPLGMMIYALPFREEIVLRLAHAYQKATDWHRITPDLTWAET
ncbi:MAG: amidase [Phycisphaeraceae bacterium]|nr:amidase [Phycisphaeraceae bacterium]